MVTLARPKSNMLDKLREKHAETRMSAEYVSGFSHGGTGVRGEWRGRCQQRFCSQVFANWYNHRDGRYYCGNCAEDLNNDHTNQLKVRITYGHPLLTEGRFDIGRDYRVKVS